MTWTYDGTPGNATAGERRDSVRFLVGDTDTNDQQVMDEEITFALLEASENPYGAAAIAARAIAAKYARLVTTDAEGLSQEFSQRQEHYTGLAQKLEQQAVRYGGSALGISSTGTSLSAMRAARDNEDRPPSRFYQGRFRNPNTLPDDDDRRR